MSKDVLDLFAGGSDEFDGPSDLFVAGEEIAYGGCPQEAGRPHACDVGRLVICTEMKGRDECGLGYRRDAEGTIRVQSGVCILGLLSAQSQVGLPPSQG